LNSILYFPDSSYQKSPDEFSSGFLFSKMKLKIVMNIPNVFLLSDYAGTLRAIVALR